MKLDFFFLHINNIWFEKGHDKKIVGILSLAWQQKEKIKINCVKEKCENPFVFIIKGQEFCI